MEQRSLLTLMHLDCPRGSEKSVALLTARPEDARSGLGPRWILAELFAHFSILNIWFSLCGGGRGC